MKEVLMSSTIVAPLSGSTPMLRPGAVTLNVRDLASVSRYYEETIGLTRLGTDRDTVHLGAGQNVLLVLRQRDVDLELPGSAGLFHTAFLMPARSDLGRWLRRAIAQGIQLDGASDHKVSEAIYLTDPEGNGIEVYADRPPSTWTWRNGTVAMSTDPLDVKSLMASSLNNTDAQRLPPATVVGHIHLRVGNLAEAGGFYRDSLGLDVTCHYPGATFFATGGYHHHLATNTWRSPNAPKRTGTTTGLASFELIARDRGTFEATAERLLARGGRRVDDAIEAADPWGNVVVLKAS
jgi:catechol 2,3-dioxygenase